MSRAQTYLTASLILASLPISRGAGAQTVSAVHAGPLSAKVSFHDNHFDGLQIRDAFSKRNLNFREAFVLVLKDRTELRSRSLSASPVSDAKEIIDPHRAMRQMQKASEPETKSCWSFELPSSQQSKVDWCLITRPHTQYLRTLLRITSTSQDIPIAEVRLLDFTDKGARVEGTVKGSPIVDSNMFFGLEHPLSTSIVSGDRVNTSLFRNLPLRAGQSITYSAVLGSAESGQLRRSFLAYLEKERPRPYEPFLHYNSWYDLGFQNRFDEAGTLDRVNSFGQELVRKRNVKLDSYLFDDGWDDPNTLWDFDPGFPNGFTNTGATASKYDAGIGVWLSPWGGYAKEKKERIAYGRAHGYEIVKDGYALSGPKYYSRFEQTCLDMIDKYHVNQFKFDGTGNADSVFPGSAFDSDFDAAIHLIDRLRHKKPTIFINLTTGTTASPFWLFYADSIWRGGEDHDFSGVGSQRQRWITYRDAQTYKHIVEQGPLFPLNSLMLHGIIYASHARDLTTDPKDEFADEVHSYFGEGTQLQEMYITPALLTAANWQTLASSARWSREHSATLRDTHWVGGDPNRLEVYGWAAWSPKVGILTLRNPSQEAKTFQVDVARVFELSRSAPRRYAVHAMWDGGNEWRSSRTMVSGQPVEIRLAPFQVLTLEATPTS